MFNILLLRMDRTNIHGQQRDAFQKSLSKFANVTTITNTFPNSINRNKYVQDLYSNKLNKFLFPSKLSTVINNYDCILLDCEYNIFYNEEWNNIKIPKIATLHDLHTSQKSVEHIIKHDFDLIITRYNNSLYKLLPELKKHKNKIKWLPGCIDINLFNDFHINKIFNVVMTGKKGQSYPLRQSIFDCFKCDLFFYYLSRPIDNDLKAWPVGEDYAKLLNRSKISISTTSKYKYALMKTFEITGCNSLLFSDNIKELEDLGFIPDHNFIELSTNMKKNRDLFKYYLDNDNVRNKISKNGYNLTIKKHNSDYRAMEFINILCQYFDHPQKYDIGINNYC